MASLPIVAARQLGQQTAWAELPESVKTAACGDGQGLRGYAVSSGHTDA